VETVGEGAGAVVVTVGGTVGFTVGTVGLDDPPGVDPDPSDRGAVAPAVVAGVPPDCSGAGGSVAGVTATGAAGWTVGCVASSDTDAAFNAPTGFWEPTLRIPTLAATAPLAAVTTIAAAPAKERARCLFMCRTVRVDR
jgi:hypothetical protein